MKIIMLGAPGSGRKTQAKRLAEKFGILDISAGHLLQNAIKKKTVAGQQARQLMYSGQMVPDEVILEVIKKRLRKKDAEKGFVLNGYPNNISQAVALDQILSQIDCAVDYTFLLDVDDNTVIKRLTGRRSCSRCGVRVNVSYHPQVEEDICDECGGRLVKRADDNPRSIMELVKNYNAHTLPLAEYYRQLGKNISINGNLTIRGVYKKILAELRKTEKSPTTEKSTESPALAKVEKKAEKKAENKVIKKTKHKKDSKSKEHKESKEKKKTVSKKSKKTNTHKKAAKQKHSKQKDKKAKKKS